MMPLQQAPGFRWRRSLGQPRLALTQAVRVRNGQSATRHLERHRMILLAVLVIFRQLLVRGGAKRIYG